MRRPVHRDVCVGHGLEQCRLGSGRRAVELVGQDQLVKERARTEPELAGGRGEDLHPGDVGRHEVRGELDARQPQSAHPRQSLGEGGLSHARRILEQQVAAGDHGGEGELDGWALAAHDATERVAGAGEQGVGGAGGER